MTIESFEYDFSDTDTQVSVKYIENGTEDTVLVDIVFIEGLLDHAATEARILSTLYGETSPPEISPPSEE